MQFLPVGEPMRVILLTSDECKSLLDYIYDNGYISDEFNPNMKEIVKKLEEFAAPYIYIPAAKRIK